jgi:hypothetical protein
MSIAFSVKEGDDKLQMCLVGNDINFVLDRPENFSAESISEARVSYYMTMTVRRQGRFVYRFDEHDWPWLIELVNATYNYDIQEELNKCIKMLRERPLQIFKKTEFRVEWATVEDDMTKDEQDLMVTEEQKRRFAAQQQRVARLRTIK